MGTSLVLLGIAYGIIYVLAAGRIRRDLKKETDILNARLNCTGECATCKCEE